MYRTLYKIWNFWTHSNKLLLLLICWKIKRHFTEETTPLNTRDDNPIQKPVSNWIKFKNFNMKTCGTRGGEYVNPNIWRHVKSKNNYWKQIWKQNVILAKKQFFWRKKTKNASQTGMIKQNVMIVKITLMIKTKKIESKLTFILTYWQSLQEKHWYFTFLWFVKTFPRKIDWSTVKEANTRK